MEFVQDRLFQEFMSINGHRNTFKEQQRIAKHIEEIEPFLDVIVKIKLHQESSARQAEGTGALITWGKHKGTPIRDLPQDYVDWVLANKKIPEGVRDFIQQHRQKT